MFDYIDANRCKEMNFAFVRLPILLFTAAAYKSLSIDAKLLFAFLLDRTGLSAKNEWRDEQNHIYIQYPLAEISERFGFGVHKAGKLLRELEKFGMIERVRLGQGKPDRIYVKCSEDLIRSMAADIETVESADGSPETDSPDLQNDASQDVTDEHSAMPAPALPECPESAKLLYNQTNRTRLNQSDPIDPSARTTDRTDRRALYEQIIKTNIDYDWFVSVFTLPVTDRQRPKGNQEELDELVGIMLDCICSNAKTIRVNGQDMDANVVKAQLLKLDSEHIQYVFERMYANTSEVTNVRAYLITTLYNASLTMNTAFGMDFRATFGNGGATV